MLTFQPIEASGDRGAGSDSTGRGIFGGDTAPAPGDTNDDDDNGGVRNAVTPCTATPAHGPISPSPPPPPPTLGGAYDSPDNIANINGGYTYSAAETNTDTNPRAVHGEEKADASEERASGGCAPPSMAGTLDGGGPVVCGAADGGKPGEGRVDGTRWFAVVAYPAGGFGTADGARVPGCGDGGSTEDGAVRDISPNVATRKPSALSITTKGDRARGVYTPTGADGTTAPGSRKEAGGTEHGAQSFPPMADPTPGIDSPPSASGHTTGSSGGMPGGGSPAAAANAAARGRVRAAVWRAIVPSGRVA